MSKFKVTSYNDQDKASAEILDKLVNKQYEDNKEEIDKLVLDAVMNGTSYYDAMTYKLKDILKGDVIRREKTFKSAYNMLLEELNEFKDASNRHELIDALDDIIVVATGELFKLGIDPDLSMLETLTEIESRRQNPIQADSWMRNGSNGEKWLKDKNQCPETLYQADYDDCGV